MEKDINRSVSGGGKPALLRKFDRINNGGRYGVGDKGNMRHNSDSVFTRV
jgi:hypothetical protein